MAWVYRQKGSKNWYIGYRINGVEKRISSHTPNREAAEQQAARFESLIAAKKSAADFDEVYSALSGKSIVVVSLAHQVRMWLSETARAVSGATQTKYEKATKLLIDHLKATDKGPLLSEITQQQLQQFLNERLQTVSASTVNLERKILRVFFKRATDTGALKTNPIIHIEPFKVPRQKLRRSFTSQQMRDMFQAAPNPFWRYMIVAGYYTGMRMGDLITLRIEEVDLAGHWIHRETGKVQGRFVHVPIVPDLADLLHQQILARTAGLIWPKEAATYQEHGAGQFSNAFTAILAKAGVIEKRSHESRNIGRTAKRERDGASFHAFRHNFVSELKNAGINASVVKALVGHSTDAINDLYTHLPDETLANAVRQLPNFVKETI